MSFDASKFSERYAKRKQELEEEKRKREEEEEKARKAEEEKRRLTEGARTAGTTGLSSAEEKITAPVDLTRTLYRTPDISAGDTDVSLKPYKEVNPVKDFANFSTNLWGGALDAIHRVDDTVSSKFLQAGAQTMNTLKASSLPIVGINAPENKFSEEQTEKLIDYMNGKRDLNTNFNFNRFKNSDVAKNIPQVAIIVDQLERGVYKGTAQDIKKAYDAGLQTRYNQWYENVVAPTDYKSQQQDAANIRDLGQIGGSALNWVAGTAEKAAEYIGMSMATGNPVTGAVLTAASSDRSQQAQQMRSFDLTLDQAAKDMGFDVALSVVFSKMLGGTFDFFQKSLGNAIPKKLVLNRAAQLIKNTLAAVGASYATQGTTGEIRNIYNLFQGRNVTQEQWAEPWWSLDTLKAVLITSALYTATNTAKDFRSIKNIKGLTDKYGDLNSSLSGLKKNFGMQIYDEDLPKAISTYNQGVSYIDTFFKNNNLGQYTEAMRKAYQKMWLDQTIGTPYADANIDLRLGSGGQAPTGGTPITQTPTGGTPATQAQQPITVLPPNFQPPQVVNPAFDVTPIVQAAANEQYTKDVLNSIKISENAQKEIDNIIERHRNNNDSLYQTLNAIADTIAYDNGFLTKDDDVLPFGGYREEDAVMQKAREIYDDAVKKYFEIPDTKEYDGNQLPTGSNGGEQTPTNTNAEFYTSDGKEIVKFKSGQHTKTNYTDGENVYKSPTVGGRETNEAKVYEMLKDKEGIADGSKVMVTDENNDEYAMIRTPKFNHVLSTDDVPADKRGSVAQHTDLLNGKHVDELLKGINAITDAKISYNDPLQVGYKDGNAYIFDFSNSMIENYGDDWNKYLRDNYFELARFLNEFGAKEYARQIESSITLLDRLQHDDPNTKWATTANLNEHELDIFKELEDDLYKHGIKFKNVYTVANARGIPMREGDNEVRKTETRVTDWGPFLVFSEKPLSNKFIDDWELSPIYENHFEQANAEKPAVEKPAGTTSVDRNAFKQRVADALKDFDGLDIRLSSENKQGNWGVFVKGKSKVVISGGFPTDWRYETYIPAQENGKPVSEENIKFAIDTARAELEQAYKKATETPSTGQSTSNGSNIPEELEKFAELPGAKYEVNNGIEKVTLEPNDDAWRKPIGESYKDTTQEELNGLPVYFTVHGKNSGNTYTTIYKNVNDMKKDWRKTYGGLKEIIGTGANKSRYSILSAAGKGEYYYERDRHSLGGWKWVDGNNITVDGETRTRRMQQNDAEWEANKKTFNDIEQKYGTIVTENIDGRDISYVHINKSGPKSLYKYYFRYDNPLTTNDGAQDATINTHDLDWRPVVALVEENNHTRAYAFKNTYDMKKWLDEPNTDRTLTIARNTSGSSYSLAKENGDYIWRSDYDGRRVKPEIGRPLVEEALGKYKSAFKKPPTTVRHVDVRGETFSSADEFANIMQKVIDPISETERVVFTKLKGKNIEEILGTEETSLNEHAAASKNNYKFMIDDKTKYADFIARKAAALGADYVYAVHNHPGHSAPSGDTGDLGASAQFRAVVKSATERNNHKLKYGGGLVEGYDGYSFYGGGNRKNFKSTTVVKKRYDKYGYQKDVEDYIQVPYSNGYKYDNFVDEAWTANKRPTTSTGFLSVANEIPYEVWCSKIVITDYDDRPMFVGNVLDRFLTETPSKINDLLYEISRNYGGGIVGAVTKSEGVYNSLIRDGVKVNVSVLDVPGKEKSEGNIYQDKRYLGDYSPRQFPYATLKGTKYASDTKWYTPKDEVVDDEDFIGRSRKVDEAKPQKWNGKANKPSTTQASLKPTEKSTGDNGVQKAWTTIENPRLSITAEINREIEEGRLKRKEGLGTMSRVDLENLERKMTKGMFGVGHNRMFKKAYGFFEVGNKLRPGSKWIWLAQASDFETFFHEFGHFVNDKWFKNVFKDHPAVEQELIDLAEARWEGVYKGDTRLKEGLAEAIKFFLAYPDFLYEHYPNISNVILYEFMEEPYLKKMFPKLQKMAEKWINMTPVERVLANVNKGARGKIDVNIDNAIKRVSRGTVQKWFNDLEPIWYYTLKANRKLGINRQKLDYHPENDIFHAIQNAGNQEAINQALKDGLVDDGIQITQGFNKIINNLKATKEEAKLRGMSVTEATMDNVDLLYADLVSNRALDYVERGKEPGISIANAKYTIKEAQKNPRVMEAVKTIWDDANALIMWAAAKGYIKYETAKTIIENNKHYAGMNRRIENAGVGTRVRVGNSGRNPLRGIQGSDKIIENPLINTIVNEAMLIKAVQENSALQQMDNLWDKAGGMGEFYTRTSPEMIFKGTATLENFEKELNSQLAPFGVSADDLDLSASYDMFGIGTENIPRMVMSYMKGGVRKFIKFADNDYGKSLYRALELSKGRDMPEVLEWINKIFVTPIQLGATALNPAFAISNLPSDNAQRFLSSNRWTVPYLSIVSDVLRVLPLKSKLAGKILEKVRPETMEKLNNDFKEYMRSGAPISGRYVGELKTVKNSIGEITGLTNKELFGDVVIEDFSSFCEALDRVKQHTWDKLADKLQFLSELSEFATRFGEFVATRNKLLKKGFDRETAIKAAGIQAKEVTQNFQTKGEWARYANKDIPFFSATLGGIYKAGQDFLKNPARYITRLAMLATTVGLGIKGLSDLLGGEEAKEYRKGVNKQKAYDNFLIYAGDGEFYAIKKPQGPARALINLAELLYDMAYGNIEEGEEGEALAEWVEMAAEDNLPVSKITDALPGWSSSLLENLINKDLFYGTELVTKDLKDLDPKDQYNKYTSEVAKLIGGVFNIAPIYVDNVMKDAFAGVGETTLDIIDYIVNTAQGKPTKDLKVTLMKKVDANTNSEYVDKIYELQEKYSRDANNGRLSEANADRLEELDIGVSTLKQVTKMQKAVKADTSLTKEQRQKRADELDALRTDVARYYLGKEPIVKGNKQIIEKMEFYPSKEEYEYEPYRGADKVTISFKDPKVKDRYSKLAQEYYKDELDGNYDYNEASEVEKRKIRSKARAAAKTKALNDMKEELYYEQY